MRYCTALKNSLRTKISQYLRYLIYLGQNVGFVVRNLVHVETTELYC